MNSIHDAMPMAQRISALLSDIRSNGYAVYADGEGVVIEAIDGHIRVGPPDDNGCAIISCLWSE